MLRITKKHGFNEINPNTRIIRVFEEWKYEDLFKSNAIFFPSINNLRKKNLWKERYQSAFLLDLNQANNNSINLSVNTQTKYSRRLFLVGVNKNAKNYGKTTTKTKTDLPFQLL